MAALHHELCSKANSLRTVLKRVPERRSHTKMAFVGGSGLGLYKLPTQRVSETWQDAWHRIPLPQCFCLCRHPTLRLNTCIKHLTLVLQQVCSITATVAQHVALGMDRGGAARLLSGRGSSGAVHDTALGVPQDPSLLHDLHLQT